MVDYSIRDIYYKMYMDENPDKFNDDLIYLRDKEDVLLYVDAIGKSLEIIPGIDYLGSSKEPIRKIYKPSKTGVGRPINVKKSLLDEITMEFHLHSGKEGTSNYEEKDIKTSFYFPRLYKHFYFILNGIRYKPIYQLLESGTYRNRDYIVCKTLIMPIPLGLTKKQKTFEDLDGNEYTTGTYILNMFKNTINPFLYILASKGYEETMSYMGLDNNVKLIDLANGEEFYEDAINFKISNSLGMSVDPDFINDTEEKKLIVFTLLSLFNNRLKMEKILDNDYWIKQLGSNFTTNNSAHYEKGLNILISFERTVDEITKFILRIDDEDKEDIYAVTRWMMYYFIRLGKLDNMDLSNKRIRSFAEYCMYPLLRKFSNGIYGLLNKKNPTVEDIHARLFKNPKNIITSSILKNKLNNHKNVVPVQFVNAVNSYDLFHAGLRCTMSGPQSPFNGKSDNIKLRALHPSYLGRIDLISTSAGDPGVSFTLVPFLKLAKHNHFVEDFNLDDNKNYDNDGTTKVNDVFIDDSYLVGDISNDDMIE